MNRKRAILICCAAFIAAVVVIAWPRGPKEPEYQGRKLSEWMHLAGLSRGFDPSAGVGDPSLEESKAAIRAMGTNCLPYLVECIRYEPRRSGTNWPFG
jgi:hypothetical protein